MAGEASRWGLWRGWANRPSPSSAAAGCQGFWPSCSRHPLPPRQVGRGVTLQKPMPVQAQQPRLWAEASSGQVSCLGVRAGLGCS